MKKFVRKERKVVMKRKQRIFLNKFLAIMLAVLMALPMNTLAWAAEFSDGTQETTQDARGGILKNSAAA